MATGRFWRCNTSGEILNDAAGELIQPEYLPVLKDVVDTYSAIFNRALASIYITGSVSRGVASARSDIDFFSVLSPNERLSAESAAQLSARRDILEEKYPWIQKFDLEAWESDQLAPGANGFAVCAFIVKVHSVLLFGKDLSKRHPSFYLRPEIAAEDVNQIGADIIEAVNETASDVSADNVKYWAVRVSKNVVRACFGLVMMDVGLFTRDIELCAQSYLKYCPRRKSDIEILLNQIRHPTESRAELHEILAATSRWLLPEAEDWTRRMRR